VEEEVHGLENGEWVLILAEPAGVIAALLVVGMYYYCKWLAKE
jgi:hypothetical protein